MLEFWNRNNSTIGASIIIGIVLLILPWFIKKIVWFFKYIYAKFLQDKIANIKLDWEMNKIAKDSLKQYIKSGDFTILTYVSYLYFKMKDKNSKKKNKFLKYIEIHAINQLKEFEDFTCGCGGDVQANFECEEAANIYVYLIKKYEYIL